MKEDVRIPYLGRVNSCGKADLEQGTMFTIRWDETEEPIDGDPEAQIQFSPYEDPMTDTERQVDRNGKGETDEEQDDLETEILKEARYKKMLPEAVMVALQNVANKIDMEISVGFLPENPTWIMAMTDHYCPWKRVLTILQTGH